MKILVAGGRYFSDYNLLKTKLDQYTLPLAEVEVVHGGQVTVVTERNHGRLIETRIGADYLAERWACEWYYKIHVFHANWHKYKKAAGPRRNQEMVEFVAAAKGGAIFFWNGKSPGTKDCIERVRKHGIKHKIVYYKGD